MSGLEDEAASFADLRRNWDEFGRRNPVSAINSGLPTDDWGEFFASGEDSVARLFEQLALHGITPGPGVALDFGCGAGRLTQALARRFDRAVGVDVAGSMIDLAERFNTLTDRCEYVLNVATDLSVFPDGSFDFACSLIVLQHMECALAERYVGELVRVLRPGGAAAFQVPTELLVALPLHAAALGGANPYRASIRRARHAGSGPTQPPADHGLVTQAGKPAVLEVVVTNESTTAWEPGHQIRLGKRWLSARDERVLEPEDDGTRVLLPGKLEPGSSVTVSVQATVPTSPADYLLELDLVQEGVTWFRHHGSPTLVLPVTVVGEVPGAGPIVPRMEMHGIPRERVAGAVTRAGGSLVAALEDHHAGPEWASLLYVVRRDRPDGNG